MNPIMKIKEDFKKVVNENRVSGFCIAHKPIERNNLFLINKHNGGYKEVKFGTKFNFSMDYDSSLDKTSLSSSKNELTDNLLFKSFQDAYKHLLDEAIQENNNVILYADFSFSNSGAICSLHYTECNVSDNGTIYVGFDESCFDYDISLIRGIINHDVNRNLVIRDAKTKEYFNLKNITELAMFGETELDVIHRRFNEEDSSDGYCSLFKVYSVGGKVQNIIELPTIDTKTADNIIYRVNGNIIVNKYGYTKVVNMIDGTVAGLEVGSPIYASREYNDDCSALENSLNLIIDEYLHFTSVECWGYINKRNLNEDFLVKTVSLTIDSETNTVLDIAYEDYNVI